MENKKVVAVEDSKMVRMTITQALGESFDLELFETAEEGYEYITNNPVDLILSDIVLPKMSGFELCKLIKENDDLKEIAFIFLSGVTDSENIVQGLKTGANDYVIKPFNGIELQGRVELHLDHAAARRELALAKELEAVQAMVTTYNHEINNPLSIAINAFDLMVRKNDLGEIKEVEKIKTALARITDIVKEITRISTQSENLKRTKYSSQSKMYKIKQSS